MLYLIRIRKYEAQIAAEEFLNIGISENINKSAKHAGLVEWRFKIKYVDNI